MLDGLKELRRKGAHLEVLGLELLDLKAVEAGVREEVAAQLRVLFIDDSRQELVDVKGLQADLGDDLFEKRLGDEVLELAHLLVHADLGLDLAAKGLSSLRCVELEVEI